MKEIEKVVAENITKLLKEKRITKLELAKIAEAHDSPYNHLMSNYIERMFGV